MLNYITLSVTAATSEATKVNKLDLKKNDNSVKKIY